MVHSTMGGVMSGRQINEWCVGDLAYMAEGDAVYPAGSVIPVGWVDERGRPWSSDSSGYHLIAHNRKPLRVLQSGDVVPKGARVTRVADRNHFVLGPLPDPEPEPEPDEYVVAEALRRKLERQRTLQRDPKHPGVHAEDEWGDTDRSHKPSASLTQDAIEGYRVVYLDEDESRTLVIADAIDTFGAFLRLRIVAQDLSQPGEPPRYDYGCDERWTFIPQGDVLFMDSGWEGVVREAYQAREDEEATDDA
jgi:hypothetical protein